MFAPITDNSTRREIYQAVTRQLAVMAPALNGDRILVSGKVMTEGVLGDAMRSDLRRLGSFIIVVLLVVLTVYFRYLSLAILPVITAVVSVIWTFGLLAALGIPVYLPIMLRRFTTSLRMGWRHVSPHGAPSRTVVISCAKMLDLGPTPGCSVSVHARLIVSIFVEVKLWILFPYSLDLELTPGAILNPCRVCNAKLQDRCLQGQQIHEH